MGEKSLGKVRNSIFSTSVIGKNKNYVEISSLINPEVCFVLRCE